jgi:hypothetical protein
VVPIRTFRIPVNLEAESFVCELENADGECQFSPI